MRTHVRRAGMSGRARERLLWLSRRVQGGGRHRFVETMTLDHLEDSRRPLLFSLLPRMLRRDGNTPPSLQRAFAYIDGGDRAPAIIVSSRRWNRALARSRRLAASRVRGPKP